MSKTNTIDEVLTSKGFTEDEKKAFHRMVDYAKVCQKGMEDNLKAVIEDSIKEIVNK